MSARQRPEPRPGVLAIEAYVPGKSSAPDAAKVFKLSSNETPLGPSPKALEAYHAAGATLAEYPDGSASALREAIGRAFGLDPARIVCGAGSDELLHLLAQAFVGPGEEAIHTTHSFLVYPIATLAAGGTPVVAAEKHYTAHVDTILAAVSPRTKIVFIANPNNPTGTYLPFDEIQRLRRALPKPVLLCRTFSKIHGLAALRLGWLYGPAHIVDALNRIRGPFNVSQPAIAAGVAAIGDANHVEASAAHNARWLPWLTEEIAKLGLEVTPSVANFVLIHFSAEKGRTARDADAFLTRRGLILRRLEPYHLPGALRLTVGSEEANRLVVEALAQFMGIAA